MDVDTAETGAREIDPAKGRRRETIVGGILVGLLAVVAVFF